MLLICRPHPVIETRPALTASISATITPSRDLRRRGLAETMPSKPTMSQGASIANDTSVTMAVLDAVVVFDDMDRTLSALDDSRETVDGEKLQVTPAGRPEQLS